jgi:hypothetical protein
MNGSEEERIARLESEHRFDREAYIKESTEIKQNLIYIKDTLEEIRGNQITFAKCVSDINLDLAKRPAVDDLKKCMDDVKTHDTILKIVGAVLTLSMGVLLWIGDKILRGN